MKVDVPHCRKHGIPGRLLLGCQASLAQITREARCVSANGTLHDVDFPASHLKSLVWLLRKNNLFNDHKFAILGRYAQHYKEWRALWGKTVLTNVMYGHAPEGRRGLSYTHNYVFQT